MHKFVGVLDNPQLFTLSKRIYVIAFAQVSSSMIFQGGGVSKIFGPILQFQLIMNFYWPTHLGRGDLSSANKNKNDSFFLCHLVMIIFMH